MEIIKIPFSAGGLGKTKGSESAPEEILRSMKDLYLNEKGVTAKIESRLVKVDNSDIEMSHNQILQDMRKIDSKAIIIGGDHSITYSCFKAFIEKNPGAGLLVFDAHPDLMGGEFLTHEDYLSRLIEEKILDPKKLVLVGIRNWDGKEREAIERHGIRTFPMKRLFEIGIQEACDTVMEAVSRWPSLYLSIDIDAADPAFAPGTGYTEPGGMSSRELIYFLQRLNLLKNLKMIDIVEINPKKDINNLTVMLGAKIIKELI